MVEVQHPDPSLDQTNQCPVPERLISSNPGLKFCSVLMYFTFLCTAHSNTLCYHFRISQSKGSTVFCKLKLNVFVQENLALKLD